MLQFQKLYQNSMDNYLIYKKKSNVIAGVRFFLMIGVVVSLLTGYFQKQPVLYFLACFMFVLFMILIMYHDQVKAKSRYYQAMSEVYKEHEQRMEGNWDSFIDDGNEFIDENQNISIDLDVFGKHSLFQMINITFSKRGQKKLAESLLYPNTKCSDVRKRQEAVLELSKHPEFIVKIQTYGKIMPRFQENRLEEFLSFDYTKKEKKPYFSYLLSAFTILGLIGTLMQINVPYSYALLEGGFVLQICYAFFLMASHSRLFAPVEHFHKSLAGYTEIFETLQNEQFESEFLKEMKNSLYNTGNVIEGIRQLSLISQRIHYRQNIFAFLFLNGFIGFDHLVAFQYNMWLKQYHCYIEEWFEQLALLETFMSLSILKIDDYDVVMPILSDEDIVLSFHNLRHPLIHKEIVVGNDFHIQSHMNVITGSNMSGKTTFMRTIALNLILAYAGGFVFADKMECSLMHMQTSMRVKDNVEEGISTFYGELLRIKEMITYSQQNQPMICFIDEIFKGTNSLDRIAGAKATIEKLSLPHCLTFLTTHDFELCQIDHQECYNYHFDEHYQDEHIYFDYQIKDGPSTSSNGQFLLKQLGIMESE